jgi:hypothetical protein
MINGFINFVFKNANGKTVLVTVLLYMVVGTGMMKWGEHKIATLSNKEKIQILDLCFTGYSYDSVQRKLSEYSPEARSFAAIFNATADSVYPLLYTAMLVFLIAWVYKNRIGPNSPLRFILLLPFLMMLVDFAENYHIISMLSNYPNIPVEVVNAGSFFTQLKWGLFAGILLLIPAGLLLKRKHLKSPA